MNSDEEIYLSYLCDRIMVVCDRLNKRFDMMDEQRRLFTDTDPYAPLPNSYAGYHPWEPDYQPLHLPNACPDYYVQPESSYVEYHPWQHDRSAAPLPAAVPSPPQPWSPSFLSPTNHCSSATAPQPALPAVPTPQPAISPTCSPDRIDTLSLAPLPTVPPPQTVISPPCSPGMITTAVQRKGKSSTIDGEIESTLTNIEIIGRIASINQPVIMAVDCLRDTNMGQEHIILEDNIVPTHGKTFVQVQHLLNSMDTSVGFSYVMAETRKQFAIKYAYVRYTFDPGGIPRKAKLVIGIFRCFVVPTLRTRWISTAGELIRAYL